MIIQQTVFIMKVQICYRPVTDHGKEEEDLNALVRRMIIVELKKHRKKEGTVLKRAHSDTETVIPRKRQSSKNRYRV